MKENGKFKQCKIGCYSATQLQQQWYKITRTFSPTPFAKTRVFIRSNTAAAAGIQLPLQYARQYCSRRDLSATRERENGGRIKISERLAVAATNGNRHRRAPRTERTEAMRKDNRGGIPRLNGDKESVAEWQGGGRTAEENEKGMRVARGNGGTICRESYINYSDVICMLMGYICMSTRK